MRVHESGPTEASQFGIQVGNACALRQLQMQIAKHVELQTFFLFCVVEIIGTPHQGWRHSWTQGDNDPPKLKKKKYIYIYILVLYRY